MVDTDYIRMLADDCEEAGRTATAEDFRDCAKEIDDLRNALKNLQSFVEDWAEENKHSELVNSPEMMEARVLSGDKPWKS